MNLKSLLITTVVLTTINSVVPNLLNHSQQIKDGDDPIAQIAQKYESPTINISTINYQSFYNDITNSSIKQSLEKAITPNFQISETDSWSSCHIYYGDASGADMQSLYTAKIQSDTVNLLSNVAMLTLISKIAHYYGDNINMDNKIRIGAIVKDLEIIDEFYRNIENNIIPISKNGNFTQKISTWRNNISQIISDTINRNYNNDELLTKYNGINYNQLQTYNGELHFCDDWMSTNETYSKVYLDKTINDYFHLGTSSNNDLFTISLDNNFQYRMLDFVVYHLYDFVYTDPTNYDINI